MRSRGPIRPARAPNRVDSSSMITVVGTSAKPAAVADSPPVCCRKTAITKPPSDSAP